jgi:hypothetical protein
MSKTSYPKASMEAYAGTRFMYPSCQKNPSPARPQVIALAKEFLETITLAAVTTSMITARNTGKNLRLIGSPLDYLPKRMDWKKNSPSCGLVEFFTLQMTNDVQKLYLNINLALDNTPIEARAWNTEAALSQYNWPSLSRAWILICSQANTILQSMIKFDVLHGTRYENLYLEIGALVASAQSSKTPCIRSDAIVIIPGWLDARRETRIPINASVWIFTNIWRSQVILNEISTVGAGLAQAPSLSTGTNVSIELLHCAPIPATVAWSVGGCLGAKFLNRLNENSAEIRIARSISRKVNK